LAYFLNIFFKSDSFSLKFWIEYLYNTYKIIQIFILLSNQRVPISKTILVVNRSFNHPSTASRLMFVHFPPSHHHHLHHRHLSSPSTTLRNSARCPSPLWRDVGTNSNLSTHLRSEDAPPPLPFPKGCGRLILAQRRNSALDARFMYQYQDLPEPYHQSTPGIPHHPKKRSIAVVPGLVRISNRFFWLGG
jgi:hypothetical protein